MNTNIDCKICRSHLPDLLLEPGYAAAHPELEAHMASCSECKLELDELQATFALLDGWTAPEPTPYFDSRLKARLREAAAAEPEGFFEALRSWWQYSTGRAMRPALASAMALVLVAGGTFAGVHQHDVMMNQAAASATVNDLKILDNNEQALQQMDQLLDDNSSDDGSADSAPTT